MGRIGVIGLGRMGSALGRRFAAQGADVVGWTRSGRAVDGFAAAPDLAGLVAASDTLFLSLFDDTAVAEVLDTLLALDLSGRLIVETSTVVPQILGDRAQQFAAKGAAVADAPISGGPEMVEAGSCGIFLGADEKTAARALPVLRVLTPRALHVGPLGAGLVMKTINNSMLQAYVAGLREMLPLARRAGIPLRDVLSILNAGPAGMPMVRDRMPKILGEDETVGFPLAGVAKDNDVFCRIVKAHGLSAPVLEHAGAVQREAIGKGLGELDPAVAIAAAYNA